MSEVKEEPVQVELELDDSGQPWFPRAVEKSLLDCMMRGSEVIHLRGVRRVGKSSTILKVCQKLGKEPIVVRCVDNDVTLFKIMKQKLGKVIGQNLSSESDEVGLPDAYVEWLKRDNVLVFDEIQRMSTAFQQWTQGLVDELTTRGAKFGYIVMLGSHPALADEKMMDCAAPLFKRHTALYDIFPLFPQEMEVVFRYYQIKTEEMRLHVQCITNGMPEVIKHLAKEGLLKELDDCTGQDNQAII